MYRGYIFSRPFLGERVPQHVQNLVIRNYCQIKSLHYLLSATEYAFEDSFIIFKNVINNLQDIDGVVCYSLFQLPEDKILRKEIINKIIKNKKSIHFACENLAIINEEDIQQIENMWAVKQTLPECITNIEV